MSRPLRAVAGKVVQVRKHLTEVIMNWFSTHIVDIWAIVSGVVTVASVIVKLTPTSADDEAVGKAQKFIEILALNKRK